MKNILQIALLTAALATFAAAGTTTIPAPEIDAGGAAAAIGLLAGAILVIRSRRK